MELIHFRPISYQGLIPIGGVYNVRCLNGSAHAKETFNITEVTCPLCRNPETSKNYWNRMKERIRTAHQYSPITGLKFERYQKENQ